MNNLKKRLQQKIKAGNEKPIPRYHFVLKNIAIWTIGILFLIFGILGTMQMFYFAQNLELLEFLLDMPMLAPKIIFIGLPIVWIILAIIGLLFSEQSIEHTKKGYKLCKKRLVIGILAAQIIIGGTLAQTPFAETIEHKLQHIPKVFGDLEQQKRELWANPKYGFLTGEFIEETEETIWTIEDFKERTWQINILEDTKLPPEKTFQKGEKLRVRGKLLDNQNHVFEAEKIFPMDGRRADYLKRMQRRIDQVPPEKREAFRERQKEIQNRLKGLNPEERKAVREKWKEQRAKGERPLDRGNDRTALRESPFDHESPAGRDTERPERGERSSDRELSDDRPEEPPFGRPPQERHPVN